MKYGTIVDFPNVFKYTDPMQYIGFKNGKHVFKYLNSIEVLDGPPLKYLYLSNSPDKLLREGKLILSKDDT